jgi:hypothetical protein
LDGATAEIYGVLVDRLGDVVVAGYFSGSLDFGRRTLVSDAASIDAFVAKYRGRDGSLLWVRTLHGPFRDGAVGVASDPQCGIVVTGGFTGPTARLDDMTLEGSAGVGNVFVARLRP